MQKFLLSAILFFLVLISFSLFFFFYETQFFGSKASMTRVDISADNSYVFTNPLKAQADGKEKIRVTVFILNSQGLGVLGKNVSISLDSHLILDAVQSATDQSGKALFDISSSTPGEYYLEVSVDEFKLPQKTRLTFLQ
ncbi:MAG: Ig-like domain-containing protein [Microgenomates group bacterium]